MRCDHCENEFDTVALKAKQATQIICPACGVSTIVRYSFRDSLKDMPGCIRRDAKYISQPLTVIWWVVFGSVRLLIVFSFFGR
jgi:hypothetical protein